MSGDPAETRPARILVVDDEPFNVDYLEQELDCRGFVTETASNGAEALERVATRAPDLILLDVMMPELDGISTLRILKEDPETKLIPVILMTALNAVEDRVRGIEAGADDFLSKPVDERELFARITTALSLKRTIDQTVSELQSASEQLERYGRRLRDVAILVVEWRPADPGLPEEAIEFVARRTRDEAEAQVRAHGGISARGSGRRLVAVFDGPDLRAGSLAAIDAALEAVEASPAAAAAIGVGPAHVGLTREEQGGERRWLYSATGDPVERAVGLVRTGGEHAVLLGGDVATLIGDDFELEHAGDGCFRVLCRASDARSDRRVGTLLVTDIVGSTRTLERLGDRAWAELIAEHDRVTRAELALFGGVELDTTGDGFLASFDSPAQAIRCAFAIAAGVRRLGLGLRAGLHTGEVEHLDGKARGIALHVVTRIAERANAGEVLVSSTTRELSAGSGIVFTNRGEHTLSGIGEARALYAALADPTHQRPAAEAVEPDGRAITYPAGLTSREVDVLRFVAVGLADAEVAEQLFLSVRTVNAHLRSIYRKTGLHSRAAAGRFAEEQGLL